MVLIKHLTIVLFQKTTKKQALFSPGFDCYYKDSFSSFDRQAPIEGTFPFAWHGFTNDL